MLIADSYKIGGRKTIKKKELKPFSNNSTTLIILVKFRTMPANIPIRVVIVVGCKNLKNGHFSFNFVNNVPLNNSFNTIKNNIKSIVVLIILGSVSCSNSHCLHGSKCWLSGGGMGGYSLFIFLIFYLIY